MKKPILIILGAVALLLVGGGGYYAYSNVLTGGKGSPRAQAAAARKAAAATRREMRQRMRLKAPGKTVQVGADPFVVNLADAGHYAKFTLVLAVDKDTPLTTLDSSSGGSPTLALADADQVADIVNTDSLRYSSSQLGSIAGRNRFKAQLVADISSQTDTLPLHVYFTTFAVQ
jgi:flagellar basal body-associated protein FliL